MNPYKDKVWLADSIAPGILQYHVRFTPKEQQSQKIFSISGGIFPASVYSLDACVCKSADTM